MIDLLLHTLIYFLTGILLIVLGSITEEADVAYKLWELGINQKAQRFKLRV